MLALAQPSTTIDPAWTRPLQPFRIAGNLYYVGSEDLAAFLIVTPRGDILMNANLESSPAQIRKSIEELGFKYSDIKVLLIGQGHFDHAAGIAQIKRETGAKYEVMDGDVAAVESGGRKDFYFGRSPKYWFPPAHVDRVLQDGDTVALGGTELTAHKTAGHTRGTTTWTMDVKDGSRTLHVVIIGGSSMLDGYRVAGQKSYPGIDDDFRHEFSTLASLPCDIFLGAHGSYFGLKEKYPRFKAGDKNAFIDPAGYRAYVEDRKQAFERELQKQEQALKSPAKSTSR
jgi:metallo-beta-lactamase class B